MGFFTLDLRDDPQVYSTAPALTLPTPVYPAALPLMTMRKAVPVPESEAGWGRAVMASTYYVSLWI